MEKRNQNKNDERAPKTDLDLDSEVNTTGFPRPEGESQTIQEDPDTDPNQTDKPGFKRSDV
ncbi:hypothetical protein [Flavobacterium selenitireducens]|uniref:hypothetical protein n=1 Tax=Flavobacterium selenitireducens TaxID=2722704 RepID=UPI00168B6325|nr:hypothetical protein [Flavobacterium selenitireducens]MBD3580988.1 hypothetical protein [Flavobacterium selenitireducens]